MKDFIKKHWKIIFGLFALNTALFAYNFVYERVDGTEYMKNFPLFLGTQIVIEVLLVLLVGFLSKKKWKIEKIFLALFIPLGIMSAIMTPLNQVCDEDLHMLRAYEISKGNLSPTPEKHIGVTGEFPEEVWNAMYFWKDDGEQYNRVFENATKSESGETEKRQYNETSGYSPIAYAPQILGLLIGRLLHLPIVMQFYLARIFSVIFFALVTYFAIKIITKYKEFLVFIALLPMVITQASSFSVDAALIASSFLFLASVLREIFERKEKMTVKSPAIIIVSGTILCLIKKFAYLPLTLLVFLIPTEKFNFNKIKISPKIAKVIVFALIVILSSALNNMFIVNSSGSALKVASSTILTSGFDPIRFIEMTFGTVFGADPFYLLETMFGAKLVYGHVDAPIKIYLVLVFIFAVILLIKNVERIEMKRLERIILILSPVLVAIAFYYIAYSSWHTFKDEGRVIEGIHGRYFLPLLPLIPFILQPKKPYTKEKVSVETVFIFSIFANLAVLASKVLFNL